MYGYSAAIVTSLIFGARVGDRPADPTPALRDPPRDLVRQDRSPRRDGLVLAALVVVQFLISPEVLVMCALLAAIGLLFVAGWPAGARSRAGCPCRSRHWRSASELSVVVLAYPAWFGLHGPQSVSGVLFSIAPLSGVALSGFWSPGPYGSSPMRTSVSAATRGGSGRHPNYVGWGVGAGRAAVVAWPGGDRSTWLLVVMTLVTSWLALGYLLIGGPASWAHIWLPWRLLGQLPVLRRSCPTSSHRSSPSSSPSCWPSASMRRRCSDPPVWPDGSSAPAGGLGQWLAPLS